MFAKILLVVVAILYLGLAVWCIVQPEITSQKVGFELIGDSGKSEFITVYGGLELGLAVIFLAGVVRPEWLSFSLFACLAMHFCLVFCRSMTLLKLSEVGSFTYQLAIGEWVILGLSAAAFLLQIWSSNGQGEPLSGKL